ATVLPAAVSETSLSGPNDPSPCPGRKNATPVPLIATRSILPSPVTSPDVAARAEVAGAVAEKDRDRVRAGVDGDDVGFAVAVQVAACDPVAPGHRRER